MITGCRIGEMLLPFGDLIKQAALIAEDKGVIMVGRVLLFIGHGRDKTPVQRYPVGVGTVVVIMPYHLEGVQDDITNQQNHQWQEE